MGALRKNPTDTERVLWRYLRMRQFKGFKFRRQQPLGRYVVDFVCLSKKLIVEVDGGQHLASPEDAERTAWLESQGFRVMRFWNNQVLSDMESVTKVIWDALSCGHETPHLNPPPQGGRSYSTHRFSSWAKIINCNHQLISQTPRSLRN